MEPSDLSPVTSENKKTGHALKAWPFYRMACGIALPIAAQNLAHAMITAADVIMLGFIDQNALTATSLAGQFMNILNSFFFSVTAGASVLTAQYWGKKDIASIEKIYGIALRFSLLFALLFFILAFFFPGTLMKLYTSDPDIVRLGARYLRIIAVTYLLQGFTQTYLAILRSMERMVLPAAAYISSLILNIVLNAVFIFGLFGVPKIGLTGVAIGTVAANLLTAVICLADSFLHKDIRLHFSSMLTKSKLLLKDMLKLSVPALFNDLGWGLGGALYPAILGHLAGGTDAIAADSVASVANTLGTVLCYAFGNATSIIIGKSIVENDHKTTKLYSRRMLLATAVMCAIGSGLIFAVKPLVISFFADKLNQTALGYLNLMFIINSIFIWGEGINTCLIIGCFRAGGEASYCMRMDLITMWCLSLPISCLAAFVFKLPVMGVFAITKLDEFYKMPVVIRHYIRYGWIHDLTRSQQELAEDK